MRNLITSLVIAAALLVPTLASAQAPANMPAYTPPKNADGQPDLSGIWQVLSTAAWDLQDHGATLGAPAGRGVVLGNDIPYKPEALAKKKENAAKRATLDPEAKCYLSGVPRITFMPFPFQIVQQKDKVNVLYEYNHTIREIYMNGNPHPEGHIDWWMGDSRGRWDGNTLVVDSVDFSEDTWFDRAGNYHSDALHVVERYTPISPYHIRYDVTVEDPKVFSKPWNISTILYRRIEPNAELLEYECYAYQLENEFTKEVRAFMKLQTFIGAAVVVFALPALAGAQAIFNPKDWPEGKEGPGAKAWAAERAKLPPFTAPRTKDGQPDLQGRWGGTFSGDSMEEIPKFLDVTTPPWESWVSVPADGKIPYLPWAMQEKIAHREGLGREAWSKDPTKRLYYDPQAFCLKDVPRYSERGYELVQTKDSVIEMLNWGHIYRIIPLDNRPHPSGDVRMWMGSARGHFEGDTLVIETTNMNGKMWLDSGGNYIGPNAKVTERIRLVAPNVLDYSATIDDPEVFTQPWTLSAPQRRQGVGRQGGAGGGNATPDPYAAESWEHACHEGNGEHEDEIKRLGFKWFFPPTPPAKKQ